MNPNWRPIYCPSPAPSCDRRVQHCNKFLFSSGSGSDEMYMTSEVVWHGYSRTNCTELLFGYKQRYMDILSNDKIRQMKAIMRRLTEANLTSLQCFVFACCVEKDYCCCVHALVVRSRADLQNVGEKRL